MGQRARKGRVAAEMSPAFSQFKSTPQMLSTFIISLGTWAEAEAALEKGRARACSHSSFFTPEEAVPCLLLPSFLSPSAAWLFSDLLPFVLDHLRGLLNPVFCLEKVASVGACVCW